MTGDEFEETEDFAGEEEEFQEAGETNVLRKGEETVFCPNDGEYMPYKVKGALVVRRCSKCGFERESGS